MRKYNLTTLNTISVVKMDFGYLRNITNLNISENRLAATPTNLHLLSNLKILQLSHNKFTNFPASIMALHELVFVDFILKLKISRLSFWLLL